MDHSTSSLVEQAGHETEQEGENSANNSQVFDENWDLQSPLLPRSFPRGEPGPATLLQLHAEEPVPVTKQCEAGIDPWNLCMTVAAQGMSMLFFGLVAGSFFFPWSDTMVRITLDASKSGSNLPFDFKVPLYTDATFQTTLSIFKSSHSNFMVALIVLSTVVAPSLWMLLQLVVMHGTNSLISSKNHENQGDEEGLSAQRMQGTQKRLARFMSPPLCLAKFSMSIVYVNAILLVCTSNVRFAFGGDYSPDSQGSSNGDDASGNFIFAQVVNDTRGGLVSYVLGITFGIGAFMVMKKHLSMCCNESDAINGTDHIDSAPESLHGKPFLSPPPMAFRMTPNYEELRIGENQLELSMNDSSEQDYRDLSTPLISRLRQEDPEETEENTHANEPIEKETPSVESSKSRWHDFIVFEAGLLSFLLVLPLLTENLIQLEYSGILTPVFDESVYKSTSLTLADIIGTITTKGGKGIFPFITATCLWINVVLIPSINWICCTSAWFLMSSKSKTAARFMAFPKWTHSLSNMTPFVMSIFATVASLGQVSNFLFSENNICGIVRELAGMNDASIQCLQISGVMRPALFLLLVQTIATDIFIAKFK